MVLCSVRISRKVDAMALYDAACNTAKTHDISELEFPIFIRADSPSDSCSDLPLKDLGGCSEARHLVDLISDVPINTFNFSDLERIRL